MISARPHTAESGIPPARALGHRGQVRRDVVVLHREQLAGAAETGLDLIGHQQDAVFVAHGAQHPHELRRRHVETALALHRFEDDGCHAARVDIGLEQVFERAARILHRHAMQRRRVRRAEDPPGNGPKPVLYGATLPVSAMPIIVRPWNRQRTRSRRAGRRRRAILTAFSTASAPVVKKAVLRAERPGARWLIFSASSHSWRTARSGTPYG
jgi:hypothetical protein